MRIALLRGVNAGGNKKIAMAGLKAMVEALGFTAVKTLLQSGNVVFGKTSLGLTATGRNWNTVRKIAALIGA